MQSSRPVVYPSLLGISRLPRIVSTTDHCFQSFNHVDYTGCSLNLLHTLFFRYSFFLLSYSLGATPSPPTGSHSHAFPVASRMTNLVTLLSTNWLCPSPRHYSIHPSTHPTVRPSINQSIILCTPPTTISFV